MNNNRSTKYGVRPGQLDLSVIVRPNHTVERHRTVVASQVTCRVSKERRTNFHQVVASVRAEGVSVGVGPPEVLQSTATVMPQRSVAGQIVAFRSERSSTGRSDHMDVVRVVLGLLVRVAERELAPDLNTVVLCVLRKRDVARYFLARGS